MSSNSKSGSTGLRWTKLKIPASCNDDHFLLATNPSVPLPDGVHYLQEFVSEEEEAAILKDTDEEAYVWEGFDQRRRVQRYSWGRDGDDKTSIPQALLQLGKRLEQAVGLRPLLVAVEEYSISKWSRTGEYASNHVVTTFESTSLCTCEAKSCDCFVAQIALRKSAMQHWNRPAKRQANCWTLQSPDHWTDIRMNQRSLLLKTGDCLWNWRSRLVATEEECSDNVVIVKFYSLPGNGQAGSLDEQQQNSDNFGYIPPSHDDRNRIIEPMPELEEILTIVITTSPIKSNPSTELLERAMDTFIHAGPEFAYKCRKVIVCDGFRTKEENGDANASVSQRHVNAKQAMRNGIVTTEQAENYRQFKENLRYLCSNAPVDSPFHNAVVEELDSRHGYGFALRHALRHCVSTRFVCVIQHDRTFMRRTPVAETLQAMWYHPKVKYVGMSMRSNLMYRDIFLSKYGKTYFQDLDDLVLRLPELRVNASEYGPDSKSTRSMLEYPTKKLRENILTFAETYRGSSQYVEQQEWLQSHPVEEGKHQMTLTPTLFWYDNVHIAETEHYRDFVFHPPYKMVARGGFVEDKLSPVLKRTVERLGLKEGHSRFGCFLLDDHSGMFFTGHLDGGSYITMASRKQLFKSHDK